jgi:signal transduction histidine kinase
MKDEGASILLVTADTPLAKRLAAGLARGQGAAEVAVAPTLAQARRRLLLFTPTVIVLDASLLPDGPPGERSDVAPPDGALIPDNEPLETVAAELARSAPLVALIHPNRQAELSPLIALGEVDGVASSGNFLPVLLALLDRRLRWAEQFARYEEGVQGSEPLDFGSILRHEVNNPLTDILGNAELLLVHRDRLPHGAAQRLETIADLAVRLRETVRRISNGWEARQRIASGS